VHATRIFTLAATVILLSCITAAASPHDVAKGVFGGSAAFNSFRSAQKVTVTRIHRKPDESLAKDPDVLKLDSQHNDSAELHVLAFYRSDAPASVTTDEVRKLKQLLGDPHSYTWHSEKRIEQPNATVEHDLNVPVREVRACLPDYAVMFTFHGSRANIHVLFCFRYNQMAVLVGTGNNALRVNAEEEFDPIRPELLKIVKRLFPGDSDIQALPIVLPDLTMRSRQPLPGEKPVFHD